MVSYEIYSQTTDLLQLPTRFKGYYNNSTDILQTCYRGLWDLQKYSFYSNSMGMLLVCYGIYNLRLPTGIVGKEQSLLMHVQAHLPGRLDAFNSASQEVIVVTL